MTLAKSDIFGQASDRDIGEINFGEGKTSKAILCESLIKVFGVNNFYVV